MQLGGMQKHTLEADFLQAFVGLVIAVALVARNRAALRLHVHADLVGAAGF